MCHWQKKSSSLSLISLLSPHFQSRLQKMSSQTSWQWPSVFQTAGQCTLLKADGKGTGKTTSGFFCLDLFFAFLPFAKLGTKKALVGENPLRTPADGFFLQLSSFVGLETVKLFYCPSFQVPKLASRPGRRRKKAASVAPLPPSCLSQKPHWQRFLEVEGRGGK